MNKRVIGVLTIIILSILLIIAGVKISKDHKAILSYQEKLHEVLVYNINSYKAHRELRENLVHIANSTNKDEMDRFEDKNKDLVDEMADDVSYIIYLLDDGTRINHQVNYRFLMSSDQQFELWVKSSIYLNRVEYSEIDTKTKEFLILIAKKIDEIDQTILESKLIFNENRYISYDTPKYFKINNLMLQKLTQPLNDLKQLVDDYNEHLKKAK